MKWWRAGLLAGLLTLLTLGCTAALVWNIWLRAPSPTPARSAAPATGTSATIPAPAPTLTAEAAVRPFTPGEGGHIAYVGEDGNIWVVSPDGAEPVAVTEDASGASFAYRFPTWSPDGVTLAYVELSLEGGGPHESALHLISLVDNARRRVPTEYPPFYLHWSPTGETLAFLSNWEPGRMALRMIDVAGGAEEATTVSRGAPFYFSWGPDGQQLFAHIGLDELTFLDQEGTRDPLSLEAGIFQAPHWSADGEHLAFVTPGESAEGVLNISDGRGENIEEVARESGLFTFNWSPDSQRLAYSFTVEQVGLPAFGPLWVHDVETGESEAIITQPVIAFFWSPDGEKLAFLRPDLADPERRIPQAKLQEEEEPLWFRWHIWDGERSYPLVRFAPSRSFVLEYLRFFDQYAQSISLWSPDSESLLYMGTNEDGLKGIWTLPVEEGSAPQRVARGEIATWSPR